MDYASGVLRFDTKCGDSTKVNKTLDIIIPVYNEGENIVAVLDSIASQVKTSCHVFICYDHDTDSTLPPVRKFQLSTNLKLTLTKNHGSGVLGAVKSGIAESQADAAIVFPADDTFNAGIIDEMFSEYLRGSDIVAASRFMPGGCMEGCRPSKAILVRTAAMMLHRIAQLPTHDPTNGFRLFSRRVLSQLPIESTKGWSFSLELLVKCHRLQWRVSEIPASWFERKEERSRFQILKWAPEYLRWFFYAFETTFLRKRQQSIGSLKPFISQAEPLNEQAMQESAQGIARSSRD